MNGMAASMGNGFFSAFLIHINSSYQWNMDTYAHIEHDTSFDSMHCSYNLPGNELFVNL